MAVDRTTHRLSVQREYFNKIKTGLKTIEGRAGKPGEDYKSGATSFRPGDRIQFSISGDSGSHVTCEVTDVKFYSSFQAMLLESGLDRCLPGVPDVEVGVGIYQGFPGYKERELEFGVAAIHIKLC